jgi:CubicO group peptidase (beta-lactamase class C family)
MEIKIIYSLLVLLFLQEINSQSIATQSDSSNLSEAIPALIDPLVKTNNYSGTILISQNDSILYTGAFGNADLKGTHNTQDTKFMLASTSSIFTATAIMKLAEEGKLTLETKLSTFLPNIQNADKISIHHMLAQRSGIQKIEDAVSLSNRNFTNKAQKLEDLISYFESADVLYEPGEKYNHGRSEYIVLAKIVELVSGKTFGDYLAQDIFEPLGMSNSGHYAYDTKDERLGKFALGLDAEGFSDLQKAPYLHWSAKSGHASIYSTIGDLNKFGQAVLKNEFLSAETWQKMFTDHGNNVGYGCFIRDRGMIALNGRSPGYSSYFSIDPERKRMVIMLANIYNSLTFFTGPKLDAIVEGEEYEIQNLTLEKLDKTFASGISGTYQFGPDFYRPNGKVEITFIDGRLYCDGAAMIPISDKEGVITKFVNRSYWSTLEYVSDESGKVIQMKYDDHVGTKIMRYKLWAMGFLGIVVVAFFIFYFGHRWG